MIKSIQLVPIKSVRPLFFVDVAVVKMALAAVIHFKCHLISLMPTLAVIQFVFNSYLNFIVSFTS